MSEKFVFVYGTLLSGESNHGAIKDSECVCEDAEIVGYVMHTLGPFPCIVPTHKEYDRIKGEVYAVDDETFARLDRLEGYPRFYSRVEEIALVCGKAEGYSAWVYYIPAEDMTSSKDIISSGNWREYSRSAV